MPFPFFPIGALLAGAILAAALTLFVAAMMAMDRAISRATESVVSGLVSGIRGWATEHPTVAVPDATAQTHPGDDPIEPAIAIPVARVRPSRS